MVVDVAEVIRQHGYPPIADGRNTTGVRMEWLRVSATADVEREDRDEEADQLPADDGDEPGGRWLTSGRAARR
jgi:hypothetical protein